MIRLAALVLALTASLAAQTVPPKSLLSHEVNADSSITFRYAASGATKVELNLDFYKKPLAMTRDDSGVWSVTTPVLPPEIYAYSFIVDGVHDPDPLNTQVVPNLLGLSDNVTVAGSTPQPWEATDIPHGHLDHFYYTTHISQHLPGDQSGYVVYTPPHYDSHHKGGYPVLYLLHGWSDSEVAWAAVGRANFILDSMIDSGKAVPMIVVMPLGYGDFSFVQSGHAVWDDPIKVDNNVNLFEKTMEGEIMPAVEHDYNVARGRENRAIIGLSMGGLESLTIGLHHTDQFAWVGGMSSAIHHEHFEDHFPGLDPKTANLRLLWVACGVEDDLITSNRAFTAWAKGTGFEVTAVETPGAHTWLVWRDNLLHFAPLLFRNK